MRVESRIGSPLKKSRNAGISRYRQDRRETGCSAVRPVIFGHIVYYPVWYGIYLSSLKPQLHRRNNLLVISLTSLQNSVESSDQMWNTCNSIYFYRYPSSSKLSRIRLSFIAQRVQFRRRHQRRGQVPEVRCENGRYLPILDK